MPAVAGFAPTEAADDDSSAGAPVPTDSAATAARGEAVVQPTQEQLVVTGNLSVEVDDAAKVTAELRDHLAELGGRLVTEQVYGAETSWRASISIRLPPGQVDPLIAWLSARGDIVEKRIEAADVSRQLFDQKLALTNLRLTLDRLRALLDQGGLTMQDILAIEREMTRLRGEIERIEGEKRWLEDRVALATLHIGLSNRDGAVSMAEAKFYPGPRLSMMTLLGGGDRKRNRLGGGAVIHLVVPRLTLELDVFDDVPAGDGPAENHAVIATWGAAAYSDFLGRGKRRFFNPYIGFRAGYGYLDYHAFVVQAGAGVELFKHRHAMIDANVRATGLIGRDDADAALISSLSAVFAF